jgi:hypothetical protein
MGPAADYTSFTFNDDATRGGFARQATLIALRKQARQGQGSGIGIDCRFATAPTLNSSSLTCLTDCSRTFFAEYRVRNSLFHLTSPF